MLFHIVRIYHDASQQNIKFDNEKSYIKSKSSKFVQSCSLEEVPASLCSSEMVEPYY